jgi:threonine synthase
MVSGDETMVVLNTGNGLKDVAGAMRALDLVQTRPVRVQPDFAALAQVVAGWGNTSGE